TVKKHPGKEQRARGRIKVSKQTSLVSGVKHHSGSTLPSTGVIAKVSTLAARVKAQQLVPRGWLDPQRLSGLRRGTHARRALSARSERKSQVAGDDRGIELEGLLSAQEPPQAAQHRRIVLAGEGMGVARGQDAKEVVGTGHATQQQYQPRRLQVRHGRDTLQ
ncbi:unnamed protein product, partial [Effrenium voratum]